jgi:general secretion pathway protein N
LRAEHACCIQGHATLRLSGGLGRLRLQVLPAGAAPLPGPVAGSAESTGAAVPMAPALPLGQWPASWLVGLGTPWNTLQPNGLMRVSTGGLTLDWVQGRWLIGGRADVELDAIASRLSPLEVLGNYRISLQGDPRGEAATVQLSTRSGPLQMSGSGQWAASKLRFTGQAQADAGSEIALNNLLNLIGRRQGALSLLSIG